MRTSSRVFPLIAALVVVTACVFHVSPARAEQAPLKLVFLKSDPDDPNAVYSDMREVLVESDDVTLVSQSDFMSVADDHGLALKSFREGELREMYEADIASAMDEAGVETVIVYDIFGGGRTVQLVSIGPDGTQLSDVREHVDTPISKRDSLEIFKQAFAVVIPEIEEFREARAEKRRARDQQQEQKEREAKPSESTSLTQEAVDSHKRRYGNLTRGITPRIGMVAGSRTMSLQTEANFQLDHSTPLIGIAASVDSILSVFNAERHAIGAELIARFSSFQTQFAGGGDPLTVNGTYYHFGANAKYLVGLSSDVIIYAKAGIEHLSVTLGDNDRYTGNRYFNGLAGMGLIYRFGQLADLDLSAAGLPVFSAKLSDDEMGNSNFGFGLAGAAALDFRLFDPLAITLAYRLNFYPTTYPDPNVIDAEASTTDVVHGATLMAGWRF